MELFLSGTSEHVISNIVNNTPAIYIRCYCASAMEQLSYIAYDDTATIYIRLLACPHSARQCVVLKMAKYRHTYNQTLEHLQHSSFVTLKTKQDNFRI